MRRLLALTMCAVSLGAAAQITYPYNPDGNADSLISVPDIQDFLAVYGNNFVPDEIMVGDSTLSSWIFGLTETVSQQAAIIDSLQQAHQATPVRYIRLGEECSRLGDIGFNIDIGKMQVCSPQPTSTLASNQEYLITNELDCSQSIGTSVNRDYWVRFEVIDTVLVGSLNTFSPFTTTGFNSCGSSEYQIQMFRSGEVDTFDENGDLGVLIYSGSASLLVNRMLVPGCTYSLRSFGYGQTTHRLTSTDNYSVNDLVANVKFYHATAGELELEESLLSWALLYNFGNGGLNGNVLSLRESWTLGWATISP